MNGGSSPLVVVDVHYIGKGARAAAVSIRNWASSDVLAVRTAWVDDVPPYEPGRFFVRELPPLRAVLSQFGPVAVVVIDGFVDLDPAGRPGLGRHLYEAVGVPVVGVAKTRFRGADHACAVRRGTAIRPLIVTSVGLPVEEAAVHVASMAGRFRVPDVLRLVDRIARSGDVSLRAIPGDRHG
jgi:deoxyribonuclease V